MVLAYDEASGELGYFTVIDTIVHEDPVVQYLTIDGETITTTPNHPFKTGTGKWVAAGKLQAGDTIRTAQGDTGTVEASTFAYAPQPVYNLTVATAHTYFVGEGQWLVHNARKCGYKLQPHGGATGMDVRAKGYHINSDAGELGLRPFRKGDGSIGVNVVTAMGDHPIDPNVAAGAIKFVQNEQGKVANQLRGIISNHSHNQAFDGRVNEARMLLEWLGATP